MRRMKRIEFVWRIKFVRDVLSWSDGYNVWNVCWFDVVTSHRIKSINYNIRSFWHMVKCYVLCHGRWLFLWRSGKWLNSSYETNTHLRGLIDGPLNYSQKWRLNLGDEHANETTEDLIAFNPAIFLFRFCLCDVNSQVCWHIWCAISTASGKEIDI